MQLLPGAVGTCALRALISYVKHLTILRPPRCEEVRVTWEDMFRLSGTQIQLCPAFESPLPRCQRCQWRSLQMTPALAIWVIPSHSSLPGWGPSVPCLNSWSTGFMSSITRELFHTTKFWGGLLCRINSPNCHNYHVSVQINFRHIQAYTCIYVTPFCFKINRSKLCILSHTNTLNKESVQKCSTHKFADIR